MYKAFFNQTPPELLRLRIEAVNSYQHAVETLNAMAANYGWSRSTSEFSEVVQTELVWRALIQVEEAITRAASPNAVMTSFRMIQAQLKRSLNPGLPFPLHPGYRTAERRLFEGPNSLFTIIGRELSNLTGAAKREAYHAKYDKQ